MFVAASKLAQTRKLPAADTNEVPWAKWTGEVKDFDEFDGSRQAVIEYLDDSYMPVGDYALPPEAIQGGYVEIKTLAKTGRVIPRLTHLAKPKRQREEETATNHLFEDKPGTEEKVTVKDLVEAINKEQVKPKTTITQGLRTVDEQSDTWAALQLHSWHETIKFKCVLGPAAIEPIIANWHFEVMKLTNDLALISGKVNPVQLRQFNAARDQVGRWLRYSGDLRMDTKRSWKLPYHLLFQLVSAMVTLAYGDRRGDQAAAELKAEFDKPAAVMDLSSILNRIFRGRRGQRPNDGRTTTSRDRNWRQPQRKPGTDKPTGHPDEKQCFRCKKYHVGTGLGRQFWSTHQC